MEQFAYYGIKPNLPKNAPKTLFVQEEKNELFLSPHVRLCGFPGMAHIESEALAHQYAEACAPIFQKRYGVDASLVVSAFELLGKGKSYERLVQRIKKDSEIIRKRLATGNLAPNKAP
jgi:hypothetical protein